MIELEIDRRNLHQWDYGQRVKIGYPAGTIVHFYADWASDEGAKSLEAYEEDGGVYANIPNIFLTNPGSITAYIFLSDGKGGHTEEKRIFNVLEKPKPADYIYTETEVLTWQQLDERLKKVEEGGGGSGGGGASTLTVTIAEGQASHTPKEIYDHIQNGGDVVGTIFDGNFRCQLAYVNESQAEFVVVAPNMVGGVQTNLITANGKVVNGSFYTLTPEDVYGELNSRVEQLEGNSIELSDIRLDIVELRNKPHLSEANVQTLIDESIAKIAVYNGEVEDV